MKNWIIYKERHIWKLQCGQEIKLSIKRHWRSVSRSNQRSPSLLVRILAPQWGILAIWHLILPPLWVTLTIGRILTLNALDLSSHRLFISNIQVKRLLRLLTLGIWVLYLLSLSIQVVNLIPLNKRILNLVPLGIRIIHLMPLDIGILQLLPFTKRILYLLTQEIRVLYLLICI